MKSVEEGGGTRQKISKRPANGKPQTKIIRGQEELNRRFQLLLFYYFSIKNLSHGSH